MNISTIFSYNVINISNTLKIFLVSNPMQMFPLGAVRPLHLLFLLCRDGGQNFGHGTHWLQNLSGRSLEQTGSLYSPLRVSIWHTPVT